MITGEPYDPNTPEGRAAEERLSAAVAEVRLAVEARRRAKELAAEQKPAAQR